MAEDSPDVNAMYKLVNKRHELQKKFEDDGYSADKAKEMVNECLPLRRIDAAAAGSVRAAVQPDTAAIKVEAANAKLHNLLQRNGGEAGRGSSAVGESDSTKICGKTDPIVDISVLFYCKNDFVNLAQMLYDGDDEKMGLCYGRSDPKAFCAVPLPGFYCITALLSALKEHATLFSVVEHQLAAYGMKVKENFTIGSVSLSDITQKHMVELIRCIFS